MVRIWEAVAISQISGASVSFIASSIMIIMIARSKNAMTTTGTSGGNASTVSRLRCWWSASILSTSPYHRIIFGMTSSDLALSLSLLVGPFFTPKYVPQAFWGIGNYHTCAFDGLMFTAGCTGTVLYAFLLSFFCLCKIKWQMSNDDFSRRFEWKSHIFINVANIGLCVAGLATKLFNTNNSSGTFCSLAAMPTGCNQSPEIYGECDATPSLKSLKILSFVTHIAVNLVCLLGMIACMSVVCWNVMVTTGSSRRIRRILIARPQNESSDSENHQETEQTSDIINRTELNSAVLDRMKTYRIEIFKQASLYVFGFILTNVPIWVAVFHLNFRGKGLGNAFTLFSAAMFPLGGFFNILIYTRPKVATFRRRNAEHRYSWFRSFILVVKSGVVIPTLPRAIENEVDAESTGWNDFGSISTPVRSLRNVLSSADVLPTGLDYVEILRDSHGQQSMPEVVLDPLERTGSKDIDLNDNPMPENDSVKEIHNATKKISDLTTSGE